jgi:GNAT superfamily N-acetyltransferase
MIECRFEPLSYLLMHGLVDLAYEEWLEVESEYRNHAYGLDWELYQKQEDANQLRFIAMREGQNLIGYVSIIMGADPHHVGLIVATFRDIFVTKSKRGHAAKLVRFAEQQLSDIGIHRVLIGSRVNNENGFSPFLKAMGFEPQERIHSKIISKGGTC